MQVPPSAMTPARCKRARAHLRQGTRACSTALTFGQLGDFHAVLANLAARPIRRRMPHCSCRHKEPRNPLCAAVPEVSSSHEAAMKPEFVV